MFHEKIKKVRVLLSGEWRVESGKLRPYYVYEGRCHVEDDVQRQRPYRSLSDDGNSLSFILLQTVIRNRAYDSLEILK